MKLADETVNIQGLHPVMRLPMSVAEDIWISAGRSEGITITAAMDGIHSAPSWHYCGAAIDIRNHYFNSAVKKQTHAELKSKLTGYDVILHDTHVHIEPGNELAKQWGLLI